MVSHLDANKMLYKGYLYHLVRGNDIEHDVSSIDFVSIVNEFQYVFPDDLPWIPYEHEVDFFVYLDPNTKPISSTPYRKTPAELKELKL